MQVQARPMEMLVVDHLLDNAHLMSRPAKENILKLINHELMRREDHYIPPLSDTNKFNLCARGESTKMVVNKVDRLGRNALWHAAADGDFAKLSSLLPHCSKNVLNRADRFQSTPLIAALFYGHPELALELISRGAEVNHVDDQERSALHYAAYNGRFLVVEALIEKGARVNKITDGGDTPLHFCCYSTEPCLNTLSALYKGGAFLDVFNSAGHAPMHFAIRSRNLSTLQWLLYHSASINIYDKKGNDLRTYIKIHGDEMLLECFDRHFEQLNKQKYISNNK